MSMTLAEVVEIRDAVKAAYLDVLTKGQHYQISGRTFTRADLATLRDELIRWDKEVSRLQDSPNGSGRIRILEGTDYEF